jgi:hypothetical protein
MMSKGNLGINDKKDIIIPASGLANSLAFGSGARKTHKDTDNFLSR